MQGELEDLLEEKNVDYKIIMFCKSMQSPLEIARALSIQTGQVITTLLIKNTSNNNYWGAVLAGGKNLKDFEYKNLEFNLGYDFDYDENTITPIDIAELVQKNIKSIMDNSLLLHDNICAISSEGTCAYEFNPKDLYKLLSPILIGKL